MFSNMGRKIMTLGKVICWLGIILKLIIGVTAIIMVNKRSYYVDSDTQIYVTLGAIAFMIIGALFSWVASFLLIGYGEMIEHTNSIDAKLDR